MLKANPIRQAGAPEFLKLADLNGFIYKGEAYLRVVPGKALFNSSMVHQVVNRGDVFAMRIKDQWLTIIPGIAKVEHVTVSAHWMQAAPKQLSLNLDEMNLSNESL
jgi:hypothetical protein